MTGRTEPGKNAYSENPAEVVSMILETARISKSRESLMTVLGCLDLTSLNTEDTSGRIIHLCKRIRELPSRFPGYPNVAAICVFPAFLPLVSRNLHAPDVRIVSVGAGFPYSQTFPEVKIAECAQAAEAGASEIDVVLPVGKFLEGDNDSIAWEIDRIKNAIGKAKLKVILETGLLSSPADIFRASMLCIESGADFIKTSTGMISPAATPEAVLVMCEAIKHHFKASGRKTGIKPAGGIRTAVQALQYLSIVREVLGKDWIGPALFRIGASGLANSILDELQCIESGEMKNLQYF